MMPIGNFRSPRVFDRRQNDNRRICLRNLANGLGNQSKAFFFIRALKHRSRELLGSADPPGASSRICIQVSVFNSNSRGGC